MTVQYGGCEPILCAPLLRRVDEKLIELLGSLLPEEWELQTVAPLWRVRDVAAHLLDTPLRKLSMVRDSWFAEAVEIRSPQDLVDLVNRLNREGVAVYRRLSPHVLIELMKTATEENARFHESLKPFERAAFNVSWAGEEISFNWFDTARELTERWHHQQQIRLATNRPGIMTPELYHPVLDCFMRGLPHQFRDVGTELGTTVAIEIRGACGGWWLLRKEPSGWRFTQERDGAFDAHVTIPEELAWRIFTKGTARDEARAQMEIVGAQGLGERVLQLTAIVG